MPVLASKWKVHGDGSMVAFASAGQWVVEKQCIELKEIGSERE